MERTYVLRLEKDGIYCGHDKRLCLWNFLNSDRPCFIMEIVTKDEYRTLVGHNILRRKGTQKIPRYMDFIRQKYEECPIEEVES